MAYLFYTISFLFLAFSTRKPRPSSLAPTKPNCSTVLYATRSLWLSHAPPIPYLTAPGPVPSQLLSYPPLSWFTTSHRYISLPSSFQNDLEAGFSSSTFDLHENLESGDARQGLDDRGKREVEGIMKRDGVGFDEARRRWMLEKFGRNGIGEDGRPRDPKAVMFDR